VGDARRCAWLAGRIQRVCSYTLHKLPLTLVDAHSLVIVLINVTAHSPHHFHLLVHVGVAGFDHGGGFGSFGCSYHGFRGCSDGMEPPRYRRLIPVQTLFTIVDTRCSTFSPLFFACYECILAHMPHIPCTKAHAHSFRIRVHTSFLLPGHVERLRTVSLLDESVPSENASLLRHGASATRHILLRGDTVICDLGPHVKTVRLPFPSTAFSKDKEP
jgi:hypothetical protein